MDLHSKKPGSDVVIKARGFVRASASPMRWSTITVSGMLFVVAFVAVSLSLFRAYVSAPLDLGCGFIPSFATSSDGSSLAIAILDRPQSGSQGVALCRMPSARLSDVFPMKIETTDCLALSSDGKYVVLASVNGVSFWNVKERRKCWELPNRDELPIRTISFTPDGKAVALGGVAMGVRFLSIETGDENVQVGPDRSGVEVSSIAFSPDGKLLAAAYSEPPCAKVWDVATWTERYTLRHENSVWSVDFSPDGGTLATGSWDGGAILWDVATGTQKDVIHVLAQVNQVRFSKDGHTLAVACEYFSAPARVSIWDLASRKERISLGPLASPGERVVCDFLPDRPLLATVDGKLRFWDTWSGRECKLYSQRTPWLEWLLLAVLISCVSWPVFKRFATGKGCGIGARTG